MKQAKYILAFLALAIVLMSVVMACGVKEAIEKEIVEETEPAKHCKHFYPEKSLFLDDLFSNDIICEDVDTCIRYVLESDDYRSQVPEFDRYLVCE